MLGNAAAADDTHQIHSTAQRRKARESNLRNDFIISAPHLIGPKNKHHCHTGNWTSAILLFSKLMDHASTGTASHRLTFFYCILHSSAGPHVATYKLSKVWLPLHRQQYPYDSYNITPQPFFLYAPSLSICLMHILTVYGMKVILQYLTALCTKHIWSVTA